MSWSRQRGRWQARYTEANGKLRTIGLYDTQETPRRVAVAVDEPAAGRSVTRLIKLYLLRRSSRRRAASLADMGRTSSLLGRAHVVTSVTWLK